MGLLEQVPGDGARGCQVIFAALAKSASGRFFYDLKSLPPQSVWVLCAMNIGVFDSISVKFRAIIFLDAAGRSFRREQLTLYGLADRSG